MGIMFSKTYNDFTEKEKWFYHWFKSIGWREGYAMKYDELTQKYTFWSPFL